MVRDGDRLSRPFDLGQDAFSRALASLLLMDFMP